MMSDNNFFAERHSYGSDWRPERGVLREYWSINGEVCIKGLFPPFAGGSRLAHCLTWLLRSFASRCRKVRKGTGELGFTYTGARTSTTLAWALSLGFDLSLQDLNLIRWHVRRRGGDPAACRWPGLWLEGATVEYIPVPSGRAVPQKLVVLAEQQQVFISAKSAGITDRVRRKWEEGLKALAGVDERAVVRILDGDEECFLVNMFVLVHQQPAGRVQPRPSLKESYRRHEDLIAELAPPGEAKRLPVRWHALWRLPPGMTWNEPKGISWMRYPAVSFVMGVRILKSDTAPVDPVRDG